MAIPGLPGGFIIYQRYPSIFALKGRLLCERLPGFAQTIWGEPMPAGIRAAWANPAAFGFVALALAGCGGDGVGGAGGGGGHRGVDQCPSAAK